MMTYCVRRCLMSAVNIVTSPRRLLTSPACIQAQSKARDIPSEVSGAYCLDSRAVVRVAGRDTVDLLQGVVTSDVTELMDIRRSVLVQYSMMLNVQGRVLYDLILYNNSKLLDDVCFLVECDASLKDEFIKAVKRYRIRKKVDISDVSDEYRVWFIPSDIDPTQPMTGQPGEDEADKLKTVNCGLDVPNTIFRVSDPRVPLFGQRVIFKNGDETLEQVSENGEQYTSLRYRWGIPEGPQDLPPGNCLPLESNLTIMNGVSFLKGCYIGQELTARTHHTGVIRKRLLPLVFDSELPCAENDAKITTDKGKNAGKLRGIVGKIGFGLLRLEHHDKMLYVNGKESEKLQLSSYRPGWWPEELRK